MLTALIIVAALIVVLLVVASTRPESLAVSRSANIKAAPDKIHPLINDFHNWPQWSPWENIEPSMARSHSGAASGKGAAYAWEGKKVGAGRMEITDATPSRITIKLDFLKPFEAHNTTVYTLDGQGEGTQVTWTMSGNNNFLSKLMQVFSTMDKMVGGDFERGLANVKRVAES